MFFFFRRVFGGLGAGVDNLLLENENHFVLEDGDGVLVL